MLHNRGSRSLLEIHLAAVIRKNRLKIRSSTGPKAHVAGNIFSTFIRVSRPDR